MFSIQIKSTMKIQTVDMSLYVIEQHLMINCIKLDQQHFALNVLLDNVPD